jgi:streptogramin lyase
MKKWIIAGCLVLAGLVFAGDYAINSSANASTCIAPARNITAAPAWVKTNAVSQGVVKSSSGMLYMATAAGTTGTNAPKHFGGIATDGGVLWLRIPSGSRTFLSVVAEGDGDVWYQDSASSTNGGVYASQKGQQYTDETDAAVYVWTTGVIKFNVKDR